jgi:hypothetical protein
MIALQRIGLSPKGERFEDQFHTVLIREIADGAEDMPPVPIAGLKCPESMNDRLPCRFDDELDPPAAFPVRPDECISPLPRGRGDLG